MKIRILPLLLAAMLLTGCGGQAAPMFDPETVREASAPAAAQYLAHSETFFNGDGSVEFSVNIDTEIPADPMPMLEAQPLKLTGADAKAVIDAFFPEANCWEKHPKHTSPETYWTKAELEENIQRWRSYNYDDLASFYGGAENLPGVMDIDGSDVAYMDYWQESLGYFEDLLEKAPESESRIPSLWHMFKETEYHVEPEEAERMDLSQDRDCLMASVEVGKDTYSYVVASGLQNGKPSSLISLSYVTRSSPGEIDWQIFLMENDALPVPTQDDLDKAQTIAQNYVDRFPIGDWILEEARPSDHDGTIYVTGRPAGSQLPDAVNLSSYDAPRLSIRIHPDGRLLDFWMGGALTDIVTHTTQAAELPMEELLQIGLDCLKKGKTMAFDVPEEVLISLQIGAGEDFYCKVNVTEAAHSYACLTTSNGGVGYVPSLTLSGEVSYLAKESGTEQTESPLLPKGTVPLVIINAIDGSIVPGDS